MPVRTLPVLLLTYLLSCALLEELYLDLTRKYLRGKIDHETGSPRGDRAGRYYRIHSVRLTEGKE